MEATELPNSGQYYLTFLTGYACTVAPTPTPSIITPTISPGSIMLIFAFCCLSTYLLFGSIYKVRKEDKRGVDALPNIEFWKDLPSLIKEGALFVFRCCGGGASSYSNL